jgi:hypothetical protein
VKAATLALESLRKGWKEIKDHHPLVFHFPGITGGGDNKANDDGKNLSLLLPKFFLCFWLGALAFVIFNIYYDWILLENNDPNPIPYIEEHLWMLRCIVGFK